MNIKKPSLNIFEVRFFHSFLNEYENIVGGKQDTINVYKCVVIKYCIGVFPYYISYYLIKLINQFSQSIISMD